ncbi:MAG: RsmG family class I SAM-dependent methyltransferase [Acidimicrobiales bacterium]|jgi:16S rRNA (guanine527-N7)-methyltransferase
MVDAADPTPDDGMSALDTIRSILLRSAELGFVGAVPMDDQIEHALGFRAAVEGALGRVPGSVLDLGTGGGLPGLVLAAVWPTTRVVLLDASQRRTEFLHRELAVWGCPDRVAVVRGRAEESGRSPELIEALEVVTARSFGPPAVTAECAAPFLQIGGLLAVSEPPDDRPADRWVDEGLALLGLARRSSFRYRHRFGYQVLEKVGETPERYPRRSGIPAKRPLF